MYEPSNSTPNPQPPPNLSRTNLPLTHPPHIFSTSKPNSSPHPPSPEPNPLLPRTHPNPHLRLSIEFQIATQRLLDRLEADAIKRPINRKVGARGRTGGYFEGEVVDDATDGEGVVVVGCCVEGGDVEGGVREGGQEGECCGGGDEVELWRGER